MTARILAALPKFNRTDDPDPLRALESRIARLEIAVWVLLAANAPDALSTLATLLGG